MYTTNEQQTLTLLEQTYHTVKSSFYLLRDEQLTNVQLDKMHSELRDAADNLFSAVQLIKQLEAAQ